MFKGAFRTVNIGGMGGEEQAKQPGVTIENVEKEMDGERKMDHEDEEQGEAPPGEMPNEDVTD